MNIPAVTVQGLVKPDGTLELEGKLPLPAGKVQVTVQPLPQLPSDDPFWQLLEEIWAGQKARGHIPRSEEEVESERRQVRADWEARMREIERLQTESRRSRGQAE